MNPRGFGWSAALVMAALSLAAPGWAQDRGHAAGGGGDSGGARANSGGASSGSAVSRGSDGGSYSGGSMSSGAATSGASSGFGSGSSSGSSYTAPSPSPMGGMAAPGGGARARNAGASGRSFPRNEAAASSVDRAVPGGSRPNVNNSPILGSAVARGTAPVAPGGNAGTTAPWWEGYYGGYNGGYYGAAYGYYPGYSSLYSPYSPWGMWPYYSWNPYYLYGYGAYGLGSFYYDPTWFGGMSGGMWPASGYSGDSGGSYIRGGASSDGVVKGGLKLKVSPKDAEVYVDGALQGTIDQFNGAFQRLSLPVGAHHLELRAKGYEPLSFDVIVEPRDTITYHGTMQPAQVK